MRENDKWGILALSYEVRRLAGRSNNPARVGIFVRQLLPSVAAHARSRFRGYLLVWYLFSFELWFEGFGIDFSVANSVPLLIQGMIFMYVLYWFGRSVSGRGRPRPRVDDSIAPRTVSTGALGFRAALLNAATWVRRAGRWADRRLERVVRALSSASAAAEVHRLGVQRASRRHNMHDHPDEAYYADIYLAWNPRDVASRASVANC